ncbi:CbtA family protein [Streptomyces sp. HNM0575]|uniref:CbtA family protein n=1 Tax=Streptomyces sp. HNM0575 TaxID=2716338 RepID=UPI00145F0A9E|nr:CbtA family protein [Streptomyces sp. HNM0575]NLU74456.1 CbtA family protein [Streptomyces sp. HNM0575]
MNSATVRTLLVRGMLAGLVAGLLALVAASFLGEPQVDAAISFEQAHSHEHGEEIVSRTMQATAGLATAVLVYGVALGGIASLAFSFALGRVGRFGPRATAVLLSGAAFVCVYLVPFLKYPANPPSVGDPASIDRRTALYFLMVLLSVLLAVAATILGKRLAPRLGNWYATVSAVLGFAFVVGLAYAFLPSVNELPEHFPALLLWRFRVSALAVQLVLWTAFGLVFGHLAERALGARAGARAAEGADGADGEKGQASPSTAPAAN